MRVRCISELHLCQCRSMCSLRKVLCTGFSFIHQCWQLNQRKCATHPWQGKENNTFDNRISNISSSLTHFTFVWLKMREQNDFTFFIFFRKGLFRSVNLLLLLIHSELLKEYKIYNKNRDYVQFGLGTVVCIYTDICIMVFFVSWLSIYTWLTITYILHFIWH